MFGGATTLANCGVGILSMLDKETQQVIQKASKSIIQIVSKKILEKVAAKQLSLEEGLKVVQNLETKCEQLNINEPLEINENLKLSENLDKIEQEQQPKVLILRDAQEFVKIEKLAKVKNRSELPVKKKIFDRLTKLLKCQHNHKLKHKTEEVSENGLEINSFEDNPSNTFDNIELPERINNLSGHGKDSDIIIIL